VIRREDGDKPRSQRQPQENQMNRNTKHLIAITCCSLMTTLLPLTFTGCASTPTRDSTGQYIDDSTITAKIKADYAKDPVVSALEVHVETFKGVVQLSGFVDSQDAANKAAEIAKGVAGVVKVDNNLIVRTSSENK
jgi:hyperosmotically inducible protein